MKKLRYILFILIIVSGIFSYVSSSVESDESLPSSNEIGGRDQNNHPHHVRYLKPNDYIFKIKRKYRNEYEGFSKYFRYKRYKLQRLQKFLKQIVGTNHHLNKVLSEPT